MLLSLLSFATRRTGGEPSLSDADTPCFSFLSFPDPTLEGAALRGGCFRLMRMPPSMTRRSLVNSSG